MQVQGHKEPVPGVCHGNYYLNRGRLPGIERRRKDLMTFPEGMRWHEPHWPLLAKRWAVMLLPSRSPLTGYQRWDVFVTRPPSLPAPHLLTREHPWKTDHLYAANPSSFNDLTCIQPLLAPNTTAHITGILLLFFLSSQPHPSTINNHPFN